MATLFNVVTKDGFIARPDGSEDFILDDYWPVFLDLCKSHGAVILGRHTYESVQKYDAALRGPFEALPIKRIIISRDPKFDAGPAYVVARSPEEALAIAPGALVSSGPTLNTYLLEHKLARRVIQYEVPLTIGEGIPVYAPHVHQELILEPDVCEDRGATVCTYRVKQSPMDEERC